MPTKTIGILLPTKKRQAKTCRFYKSINFFGELGDYSE
jgi:hypothetical protein